MCANKLTDHICSYCKVPFKRKYYEKAPKYCSLRCQHDERMVAKVEDVRNGLVREPTTLRRVLSELFGYNCSTCNISEWESKKLVLQVDHIDGNPGNNYVDNLRLLCPNCHSQTSTYKGGNKKNPKKDERSKYHRAFYAKTKAKMLSE